MSFDPTYPAYPVFSFIAFILVLIPLPWHLQAWNSGTCLYMVWTAIGCLNYFVNSIVWHGNAIDWAPGWCDISTRLTVALSVAIPASALCIHRRLYKIATVQSVSITRAEKKRAILVDLSIGFGIPVLQMGLQIIVQGHRYDIWEDIGCLPRNFNTPLAYPLSYLWPLAISLVSAVYCLLTLRAFIKRRLQFRDILSANSSLTMNRYLRLMALATVELVFNLSINSYGTYLTTTAIPIQPWRGWADAHFDWYTIDTFPAILWRMNTRNIVSLELGRWSVVFCALLFFAFFGFADEARRNYRLAYQALTKKLGFFIVPEPPVAISSPRWKKQTSILPITSEMNSHDSASERSLNPHTYVQPTPVKHSLLSSKVSHVITDVSSPVPSLPTGSSASTYILSSLSSSAGSLPRPTQYTDTNEERRTLYFIAI